MVGILLVSHGKLAEGILDAMTMIVGEQEAVSCLSLKPSDSIESLTVRVVSEATKLNQGEGVLVLTDLFGASPFNASGMASQSCEFSMDIITGFNLGMLIEIVMGREGMTLQELASMAKEAGINSIKKLSEEMDLS
jgi:PTS system mannose-specific IIA component